MQTQSSRITSKAAAVIAAATFLTLASCANGPDTAPWAAFNAGRPASEAIAQAMEAQDQGAAASAHTAATLAEPVVLRLSLAACFELMQAHNREVVLERIRGELADASVVRAGAFTDVTLGARFFMDRSEEPLQTGLSGDTRTEAIEKSQSGSATATMPFYTGTTVTLEHGFRRVTTNSPFNRFEWDSNLSATVRQKLLDGFGVAVNRADLDVAELEAAATRGEVTQAVAGIRFSVAEAYWNLVLAREELAVLERQRESARIALAASQRREREGLDSGLDVLRARSTLTARDRDIVQQQLQVERASDALLRTIHPDLLSGYALIPGYSLSVEPREALGGDFSAVVVPSIHGQLQIALGARKDLQSAVRRLEAAGIRVKQRDNATLPDLDLELSAELQGFGSSYGRSVDQVTGLDGRTLRGGLIFEIPIGDSNAKAGTMQSKAELERAMIQLRDAETTVVTEVVDAVREIAAGNRVVAAAIEARDLARQEYQAATFRRSLDRSTSFEVKEAEAEQTARERDVLKARVDLELARLRLLRATGVTD